MFLNNNWIFIKALKKYESLSSTGFCKCPTEFYIFPASCPTGFEKLFAALS